MGFDAAYYDRFYESAGTRVHGAKEIARLCTAVTSLLELFFRACFILYGKDTKILTKKLAATARAPA